MKHQFILRQQNPRLLIFFLGWGMDPKIAENIRRHGYDTLVVWDYTSLHIDWSITEGYDEICIFAWSMGVYAATLTTQALAPRTTLSVAINGTDCPISSRYGIPEDIFHGTLDGLSERNLAKFFRRMCADRQQHIHFLEHAPQRAVDDLRDELQAIEDSLLLHTVPYSSWDFAIVGRHDRIFPFHNQLAAWKNNNVRVKVVDEGHYFDFSRLTDTYLIDKPLVRERFGTGNSTYRENAGVQAVVVDNIMEMCRDHRISDYLMRSCNPILEIGSGAGLLSVQLARYIRNATLEMWDLASPMPTHLPDFRRYIFRNCDAEMGIRRLASEQIDAIFSASTIQWFNSPSKFLKEVHRVLRKDGYAVISTFTEGNLQEISELTGTSLPLMSAQELTREAERWFEVVEVYSFERDLDFESPRDVLLHMRLTGVNAVSSESLSGAAMARRILSSYRMRLDGRYHLTYKPIILILKKK